MKLKKLFILILLIPLVLSGCSKEQEEENVDLEFEATNLLLNAAKKLKSYDQVNMYSYCDLFSDGHSEWKNKTENEKIVAGENGLAIINNYKSWYNSSYCVTNIDNVNNEKRYTYTYSDYTDYATSEGNKFIDVTENGIYFGFGKGEEYDLNIDNIKKAHMPYYGKIKNGDIYKDVELIVKDNKVTGYVGGKLKGENIEIPENDYADLSGIRGISSSYQQGPLDYLIEVLETGNALDSFIPFGGLTFPYNKIAFNISIDNKDDETIIKYIYDKSLVAQSNEFNNSTSDGEVSSFPASYYDDGTEMTAVIDKDGNLERLEYCTITGHLNEGIEDFKIPEYAIIEFEHQ